MTTPARCSIYDTASPASRYHPATLFAPVVPAARWAPYGVPTVLLGDQDAPCRDTRARHCPVPGHPCLTTVRPADVVEAVDSLLVAA